MVERFYWLRDMPQDKEHGVCFNILKIDTLLIRKEKKRFFQF